MPAWKRFTSPPDWSYSIVPDASLPAIARALAVCSAVRPSSLAAAAAAPNTPPTFMPCQPMSSVRRFTGPCDQTITW
jgi:hypothetical protein